MVEYAYGRECAAREKGNEVVVSHRLSLPKRLFAYTQTIVRLYPI